MSNDLRSKNELMIGGIEKGVRTGRKFEVAESHIEMAKI